MPNWVEGQLKVRGTKENIINFLKNGLEPLQPASIEIDSMIKGVEPTPIPLQIEENEYSLGLKNDNGFYIKNTRRHFIEDKWIEFYFEDEGESEVLVLENFKAAWGIETEQLAQISKEYQIDFKVYGFERGMRFNQDIEIHKGEIVKNNEVKFDNYDWECVMPSYGG